MHLCVVEEKACSVYGAPARWGDGEALDVTVQLKGQTQIRLVRAEAARYQYTVFSITIISLVNLILHKYT